jgi:uncharacterized protein YmfQ (DUF2313 family)
LVLSLGVCGKYSGSINADALSADRPTKGLNNMDYLQMLKNLLPRGRAWTARIGSTLSNLLNIFSNELDCLHGRVNDMIGEAFVLTVTSETIADWETEYGITPGINDTLAVRRARLRKKRYPRVGTTWNRGQSIPYLYSLFAAAGWNVPVNGVPSATDPHVEIVEKPYEPFRVGISRVGIDSVYWGAGCSVFSIIIKGTDILVDDVPNPLLAAIFAGALKHTTTYQGDAAFAFGGGIALPAHVEAVLINE